MRLDPEGTPSLRTVLKELKTSYLVERLYDVSLGYETVHCSQIDPPVLHSVSGIYETRGDSLYIKRIFLAKYE